MRDAKVAAAVAAILAGELRANNLERAIATILLKVEASGLHDDPKVAAQIVRAIASLTASETPVVSLAIWDLFKNARGRIGRSQVAEEFLLKGWYAVNAVKRVAKAEDKVKALQDEVRYHTDHLSASKKRIAQAKKIDAGIEDIGEKQGWHGIKDERTDAECLKNIGKNFLATRKPKAGWPGMVHRFCRCNPGPVFPGAEMVA